ncbi:MAG: hypothetical protein KGL54_12395 [Sphingomonadales bacterium]|nr:hypothetical protein [Sphingomonadales bacterium]
MSWLSKAVSSVTKPLRNLGAKIDDAVGGAKGWSKALGGVAALAAPIPVVGAAVAVGAGVAGGATAKAAADQAKAKAADQAAKAQAAQAAAAPPPGPFAGPVKALTTPIAGVPAWVVLAGAGLGLFLLIRR